MTKFSEINPKNIKSINHSSMVKNDGIKLQTLKVEFVGIENDTYQLISAEYVTESELNFEFTQRIGERFSGLGSSDGMRDEYHTVKVTDITKHDDPIMRRFTYKVKSNRKIINDFVSNFNVKNYE